MLLAKSKLNSIEVLISKALIDSNINHDEVVLINKMLKEYDVMKEEIKNLKLIEDFSPSIKQLYRIVWTVENLYKVKTQKL